MKTYQWHLPSDVMSWNHTILSAIVLDCWTTENTNVNAYANKRSHLRYACLCPRYTRWICVANCVLACIGKHCTKYSWCAEEVRYWWGSMGDVFFDNFKIWFTTPLIWFGSIASRLNWGRTVGKLGHGSGIGVEWGCKGIVRRGCLTWVWLTSSFKNLNDGYVIILITLARRAGRSAKVHFGHWSAKSPCDVSLLWGFLCLNAKDNGVNFSRFILLSLH